MSQNIGIGKTGLGLSAAVALALIALAYVYQPALELSGMPGICLPPATEWIDGTWSWIVNLLVIAGIGLGINFLNREFNFIKTTQPVLPAVFLLLASSNPWLTDTLNSSVLMCAVNIISLALLFGVYDITNATRELFTIGTFIAIGSMFEYAFLAMVPVYLIGALTMKVLRLKEFVAFCLGLLAPYWVAVGLGIIPLSGFRIPHTSFIFEGYQKASELFLLLLNVGTAIFIGVCIGVTNSMKLYAGNSRVNAMNFVIYVMGAVCAVCVIADFDNMLAYLGTLYFTVAVQIANLCAIWNFRHEWIITLIAALFAIAFFVLASFLDPVG